MSYEVIQGDCREVMATLDANSVDAVVCDPPYGLSFMGKGWDHSVPGVEFWEAALRAAKPGAHLLAFGGTRLFHRLAVAIEDAGWEIRDTLMWVYGSGFPKSHNGDWGGTALKPAWEPVIMARKKPEGTVAANFEKWGTGGLNIDGCRVDGKPRGTHGERTFAGRKKPKNGWGMGLCERDIPTGRWPANLLHDGSEEVVAGMGDAQRYFYCAKASNRDRDEGLENMPIVQHQSGIGGGTTFKPSWEPVIMARKKPEGTVAANFEKWGTGGMNIDSCRVGTETVKINTWDNGAKPFGNGAGNPYTGREQQGRWPANLLHDGSEEVVAGMGDAQRFFYCPKASKRDRDEGCDGMPQTIKQSVAHGDKRHGTLPYTNEPREMKPRPRANHHPTVKPTDLMAYLCRLVTPKGGIVLDPFCGSGSTGKAAVREGFNFIGIELDPEYCEIARKRIEAETVKSQLYQESSI